MTRWWLAFQMSRRCSPTSPFLLEIGFYLTTSLVALGDMDSLFSGALQLV